MPVEQTQKEMSFWDHLEELRGTLLRSLAAIFLLMCVALCFKEFVFEDIILRPASDSFITNALLGLEQKISMVNLEIAGQFMVHLRSSFIMAFVLAFPYLLWEIWRFIAPALYDKEKKPAMLVFLLGTVLFYLGVLVGYFVLLPLCLHFFQAYTVSETVVNTFSLQSYMGMFVSMVLLLGLVFEFPMLMMMLGKMGLIDRALLRKGRRYAIILVMILAAVITPADPASMIILSCPLYLLYELGILLCPKNKDQI